ncbi:MAG: hypothetical protein HRT36_03675 [Alphaproteobacteria bacterium]|nr:hypothetical protein [Alphaproteobacteria bacterium]
MKGQALEGKIFAMPLRGYWMKMCDGCEVKGERDIDPDKAAIIRRAFTLFAAGHSLFSIVNIFDAEGIRLFCIVIIEPLHDVLPEIL